MGMTRREALPRILILGYGNPFRSDDGLGWHIAVQLFRSTSSPEIEVLPCLQLTPELAEPISRAERVLFLDSTRQGTPGQFQCQQVEPVAGAASFTHELSPAVLLSIARDLYGAYPQAYILTICGESFETGESLTPSVEASVPELKARVRALIAEALHLEAAPLCC
jgi:hydrogenase maturation protease